MASRPIEQIDFEANTREINKRKQIEGAALDLLEALEGLLAAVDDDNVPVLPEYRTGPARAAIAKARGAAAKTQDPAYATTCLAEVMSQYVRDTAADMGASLATAMRAMRDEPQQVARDIMQEMPRGSVVTAADVIAWCAQHGEG